MSPSPRALRGISFKSGDRAWLSARLSSRPVRDKKKILRYLTDAPSLFIAKMLEEDALSDPPRLIDSPSFHTDGEWAWASSVAYYFDKYDFELPAEFLEWVRKKGTPPSKASLLRRSRELSNAVHDLYDLLFEYGESFEESEEGWDW